MICKICKKETKLGTFYGQEIIIKSDEDRDWVKLWEDWLKSERKMAVEHYKEDLFIKEIEKEQI